MRDVQDATKVQSHGQRIVAIGKTIDTGVFLCRRPLFAVLRQAQQHGEGSLSAAIQILADAGQAT